MPEDSGQRPPAPLGALVRIGAGLVVEIALAVLLWQWWQGQAAHAMVGMAVHSMMRHAPAPAVVATVAAIELALIVAARVWRQHTVPLCWVGAGSVAVGVGAAALGVSGSSHVVAMTEMVLATIVVPMAVVRAFGRALPGEDCAASAERERLTAGTVLAVVAAVAMIVVVFVWHLPAVHHEMSRALVLGRDASYLVVGLALWMLVTVGPGDTGRERIRGRILALAYGGMGIIALAMILGPHPLMPGMDAMLPWSALADQRGGGLLMMVGDTLLVLPVIGAATAPRPSRSEPVPAAPRRAAREEMELM
ncbi:cytochrome c oxidase assembly protein [Acidipropionibacterium acidipropionici]|uniref:cytochrome c oxidase assembly protein n=1 Tax=Acidipropionibacterium acidipropionici TaxID=1748 RepID=UPI0012FD6181|nr:cytochrome c oxidase assembly protein [Acidipropionibacterium acidipropionici]